MLPIALRFAAHHDQLAVLQHQFALLLALPVAQGKFSGGAEAERGNHGVAPQFGFVIAVPSHAFLAVAVAVEQARIEDGGADGLQVLFHRVFEMQQKRRPRLRSAGDTRIAVGKTGIAVPCHLAGGGDVFAVNQRFIMLPRDVVQ